MNGLAWVAGGNRVTAEVALGILRQGGNAVDAAVGGTLASCLSEIAFVHLGGSGIALVHDPTSDRDTVFDFFSRTPGLGLKAPPDPIDFYKTKICYGPTTQDFFLGRGSVAVPGNIFGLETLHRACGRLSWREVVEPVIQLARHGVNLDSFQARTCHLLRPIFTATQSVREIFPRSDGNLLQEGDLLRIPGLDATLESIGLDGSAFLREGPLGDALVEDQRRNGGFLTEQDLGSFHTEQRDPIRVRYRDFEVLLPPPSSTGGPLVAFSLGLLSRFDLSSLSWGSADHLRVLAEVMAAASRSRPLWEQLLKECGLGEALGVFLSDTTLAEESERVSAALNGKSPGGRFPESAAPPNTTHLSVLDRWGMAVSLSHSAGESAGYILPGTGFIPNNMLGEADLHPDGFHTALPGSSIPTMMTPIIVKKGNRVRAVLGSGGSTRIRTALLQVLSNLLDFNIPIGRAVRLSRIHYEDGILQCEGGVSPSVSESLSQDGYNVNSWGEQSVYFGGVHAIESTSEHSRFGAGDPRRGGVALSHE